MRPQVRQPTRSAAFHLKHEAKEAKRIEHRVMPTWLQAIERPASFERFFMALELSSASI
jgi:hypothetical protein